MEYTKFITCSTLTFLFFTGFRGQLLDSALAAGQPPSIDTDTDQQPVPADDEFHSRQDQAALEAAIAEFLKLLEVQQKLG